MIHEEQFSYKNQFHRQMMHVKHKLRLTAKNRDPEKIASTYSIYS